MTIACYYIEDTGENNLRVLHLSKFSLSSVFLLSSDAPRHYFAPHSLPLGIPSDPIPSPQALQLGLPDSHFSDAVLDGKMLFEQILSGQILPDQFRHSRPNIRRQSLCA
jgi:hypothetical protein